MLPCVVFSLLAFISLQSGTLLSLVGMFRLVSVHKAQNKLWWSITTHVSIMVCWCSIFSEGLLENIQTRQNEGFGERPGTGTQGWLSSPGLEVKLVSGFRISLYLYVPLASFYEFIAYKLDPTISDLCQAVVWPPLRVGFQGGMLYFDILAVRR